METSDGFNRRKVGQMTKGPSELRLALSFTLVLVYLGQPSAFTSLSGSGLMFFTAGGIAWLFLGTR